MTDFEQYDEAMEQEARYAKKMAVATLNDAVNQIYNIPGDRFQMAYDILEAVLDNLKIEVDAQPKRPYNTYIQTQKERN